MKKALVVAVVLALFPALAMADSFGERVKDAVTSPVVVFGGKYLTTAPAQGSRTQLFLTANIPGFRMIQDLYLGGVGVGLETVVPGLQNTAGAGISIPIVTYFIKGSQFVVQGGYGWDLMTTPSSGGPYAGAGFGLQGPTQLAAKKAAKKKAEAEAKKAAELLAPVERTFLVEDGGQVVMGAAQ